MNTYGYFTAPTDEFTYEFCKKCTSSYGCVCDLLIDNGHCPTCMNAPAKCVCKYHTKKIMQYFWKEACKVEGVPFTRKEHTAYPRVLATYHRLRKEHESNSGC